MIQFLYCGEEIYRSDWVHEAPRCSQAGIFKKSPHSHCTVGVSFVASIPHLRMKQKQQNKTNKNFNKMTLQYSKGQNIKKRERERFLYYLWRQTRKAKSSMCIRRPKAKKSEVDGDFLPCSPRRSLSSTSCILGLFQKVFFPPIEKTCYKF